MREDPSTEAVHAGVGETEQGSSSKEDRKN